MCTVTFCPRKTGYALAMNRDEQLTRVQGLPPRRIRAGDRFAVCPSEPGGGTWIALNDSGAALALINWYSISARVATDAVSRGEVVRRTRMSRTPEEAGETLRALPLMRMNPFRLIGVFPTVKEVMEWRWNLRKLARLSHLWCAKQWISSGFDEPKAQRVRTETFRAALDRCSVGNLSWLRRLHRCHSPQTGPFSICMHRDDAATVSYTEVIVSSGKVVMTYHQGSPCHESSPLSIGFDLDGNTGNSGRMSLFSTP